MWEQGIQPPQIQLTRGQLLTKNQLENKDHATPSESVRSAGPEMAQANGVLDLRISPLLGRLYVVDLLQIHR